MAATATEVSPKKLPIEDWVKAVKKLDASGLKDEEKKVFEMVRAHKNIPKTPNKFSNFCIHNLKVKNEKVIKKIWGHLSVALGEQKATVKETKEDKKAQLEKKLKPKDAAKTNGKSPDVAKAKQNKAQVKETKDASGEAKGNKQAKPEKQKQKPKEQPKANGKQQANENSKKVDGKQNLGKKVAAEAANLSKAQLKKQRLEKLKKMVEESGSDSDAEVTPPKKKGAQPVKGQVSDQGKKKKVSFSKNGTPEESKTTKKGDLSAKLHKPTPKKVNDSKKKDLKKKGKVDEDEDDDDDLDSDDEEMSLDMDDSDLDDSDLDDEDDDLSIDEDDEDDDDDDDIEDDDDDDDEDDDDE